MNKINHSFSIKDLENICGIKAHTIRIWEKRYNLLTPKRTDTNIRTYSLQNLQKLLNVTYLVNSGYKISRISKLNEEEIASYIRSIVSNKSTNTQAINSFKLATLNYDLNLFLKTYDGLIANTTFRQVFYDVFIPLLNEIGMLWQTNTIDPAHEHFISSLIKQKLLVNIEKLQQQEPAKTDKAFVLFLPKNEIHDLGLLFINYEILLSGYQTVYLGASIPLDNLKGLVTFHEQTTFVSYFTVQPEKDKINSYLKAFKAYCPQNEFWIFGKQVMDLTNTTVSNHKFFSSLEELIHHL